MAELALQLGIASIPVGLGALAHALGHWYGYPIATFLWIVIATWVRSRDEQDGIDATTHIE